jgi:hypothetical protein
MQRVSKRGLYDFTPVTDIEFILSYFIAVRKITVDTGNFSPCHCFQTVSGAHPASYPMDNRGSFPGSKAAEA